MVEQGTFHSSAATRRAVEILPNHFEHGKMHVMVYRVLLIESEEGFAVACPALSGCWSQGDTEHDAIESISDAIVELLDVGCIPEKDGGAAAEAEIMREATEERLNVIVREVQLPIPA